MSNIPTPWVTIDVSWGEGKRHLFTNDEKSLKYHHTEVDARSHAENCIRQDGGMVAIMEIKSVLVPKPVEFDELIPDPQ